MKTITAITQNPIVKRMVIIARVLFFVLGVVTTISTSQLFKSCNTADAPQHSPVASVPVIREDHREQEKIIASYDRRIEELNAENNSLQQQVMDTRTALARSHRSNAGLQAQLQRQVSNTAVLADTAERLSNCDSLAHTATALAQSCAEKDSLYNDLTGSLEQQVAIKDSTIATQEKQYNYLQLSYDRNMAQQQLLIDNNLLLQKQVSRHKARSKLLTAGMILLSGTVTYMALQR